MRVHAPAAVLYVATTETGGEQFETIAEVRRYRRAITVGGGLVSWTQSPLIGRRTRLLQYLFNVRVRAYQNAYKTCAYGNTYRGPADRISLLTDGQVFCNRIRRCALQPPNGKHTLRLSAETATQRGRRNTTTIIIIIKKFLLYARPCKR